MNVIMKYCTWELFETFSKVRYVQSRAAFYCGPNLLEQTGRTLSLHFNCVD